MDLKTLLTTTDYLGLSDAAALALLDQPRHPGSLRVKYLGLGDELTARHGLAGLSIARRLAETFTAVAAVDAYVAKIEGDLIGGGPGIELNNPTVQAMLQAWAADDLLSLTPADAAAIIALTANRMTDRELHGLASVGLRDIRWARQP